jgi:hypothetical protein
LTLRDRFLTALAGDIGYTESPAGSNRTKFAKEAGHANGQPWCATFIVAKAKAEGVTLPSTSAYTPSLAQGFKEAKAWYLIPKPGDLVFYDFPDSVHRIQHVGVVEKVLNGDTIQTIEGNTARGSGGSQSNGGGVYRRIRNTQYVVGYGRPDFREEDNKVTKEQADKIIALLEGIKADTAESVRVLHALGLDSGRVKKRLGLADDQDWNTITPLIP